MNGQHLIYDVTTTESPVIGAWILAIMVISFHLFFLSPVFLVYGLERRQQPRRTAIFQTSGKKCLLFLLAGGFLIVPMVTMVIVVSTRWSATRNAVARGDYISVTGKLAQVSVTLIDQSRHSIWIGEYDVFTLRKGNSFEIMCHIQSREPLNESHPFTCLDAQIGDTLTVDSSGSLGMRGAVPVLRVWRNEAVKG